jgi:palmitoyl-protein thioesterase
MRLDDLHKNQDHHSSPFYEMTQDEINGEFTVNQDGNGIPTAVFHSMGDSCKNPEVYELEKMIAAGTNAAVHSVGSSHFHNLFNSFETTAQKACQEIIANPDFQGEFNLVGLSQGGLLARYIAEECEMPGKVRNMLTLGSPHMGIAALPHCFTGTFCHIANHIANKFVYSSFAQNWFAPAAFFRNTENLDSYVHGSTFLPALNNEYATEGELSALRKSQFTNIN